MVSGTTKGQPQRRLQTICGRNHGIHGAPGIASDRKASLGNRSPQCANRGIVIQLHGSGAHQAGTETGASRARLDDDEVDPERRVLLGRRLDEPLDAPFGRVIEAVARVCNLAALGRKLHNPSPTLMAQVWYGRTDELDRAGQITAI